MENTYSIILNVKIDLDDDYIVTVMDDDNDIQDSRVISPDLLPAYIECAVSNYVNGIKGFNEDNPLWKDELGDFFIEYTKLGNGNLDIRVGSPIGLALVNRDLEMDEVGLFVARFVEIMLMVRSIPEGISISTLLENGGFFGEEEDL